jgi:hypothetical protein
MKTWGCYFLFFVLFVCFWLVGSKQRTTGARNVKFRAELLHRYTLRISITNNRCKLGDVAAVCVYI